MMYDVITCTTYKNELYFLDDRDEIWHVFVGNDGEPRIEFGIAIVPPTVATLLRAQRDLYK